MIFERLQEIHCKYVTVQLLLSVAYPGRLLTGFLPKRISFRRGVGITDLWRLASQFSVLSKEVLYEVKALKIAKK